MGAHEVKLGRSRGVGKWARGFTVVVATALMAVACSSETRDGTKATASGGRPSTVSPAKSSAEQIATSFVTAFGAFEGERAITYLADDARLRMDATTPDEVPVFTSFLEAMGYKQILADPCGATGSSGVGTEVRCLFDWHAIRSDEIGLGPYPGHWDLTVRDGRITDVSLHWELDEFSPQMWEPFRDWVAEKYPRDFEAMYVDRGGNFSMTEESARLWEKRSREYVAVAIAETG
jgi:hypothetical protein